MYDQSLEDLIDAVIADGVISDKERKVVRNKAEELDLDPDEVEVVLESRLQQKLDKEEADNATSSRKCPACGEMIPAMTGVCPACGYVVKLNKSDGKDLMQLLETLQQDLVKLESGNFFKFLKYKANVDKSLRKAKTFYGENKKVQSLVIDIEAAVTKCKKRLYFLIAAVLIIIIGAAGAITSCVAKHNEKMEAQKILVDKEYERVMTELNSLESIDELNYKEIEEKLLKISWNPVVELSGGRDYWNEAQEYAYEKKESYLGTKRRLAERIFSFYCLDYGGELEAWKIAPDPIAHTYSIDD